MRTLSASAPGKLVLAGEYAVLEGATAVVVAVQARARVTLVPGEASSSLPPEVRATRELAEAAHGVVIGSLVLDVASLRAGEHKLGVGSSAAAAVATAALVRHAAGCPLDSQGRDEIVSLALAGHRAVAPGGSGIDVVASAFGGAREFRRDGDRIDHRDVALPAGLEASVVFTGHSARTSDLLAKVRGLADADRTAYRACLDAIRDAASTFARALESSDVGLLLEATRAHHRAMVELGARAGAPIVESTLARVAALAEAHRGAGKPSGAGGGDVAVAFFDSRDDRLRFEASARAEGFAIVDAVLGGEGVRIDAP